MMRFTFPISGVTTWVALPLGVAFLLAFFGAMAGVTGAFLLLPFQISVLGYTAVGVSATNFVYNVFAIPGTVTRYGQEGRINWPLAAAITGGSLPGIAVGYFVRVNYLTDLRYFKPFAGAVLLYLAWLVGRSIFGKARHQDGPAPDRSARITGMKYGFSRMEFSFAGCDYGFDPRPVFLVSLIVGVVGGAYGIGGGAVLAPFCIAVLRLPVHTVAGASLLGTLACSLVGVGVYSLGVPEARPDFLLGGLFGVGGMIGGYFGARCQKYIPQRPIKIGIFAMLLIVSLRYIVTAF
jgi:uncharacterized membrane protein YfcA